jgi:hypothetical protein
VNSFLELERGETFSTFRETFIAIQFQRPVRIGHLRAAARDLLWFRDARSASFCPIGGDAR